MTTSISDEALLCYKKNIRKRKRKKKIKNHDGTKIDKKKFNFRISDHFLIFLNLPKYKVYISL